MAYESYCAACTYLGEERDYRGYYCSKKGEYRQGNDPKCYSFCEAYSRSNSARQNMYGYSSGGSGCYLTTMICKLLNFPDDNYFLNTLRDFRDNTMKSNPEYLPLLLTYDIIGPQIAYSLDTDINGKDIARLFFNTYVIPSVEAINNNNEKRAINIYESMTTTLANYYRINTNIVMSNIDVKDTNNLGHGKIRKLTLKEEL